MRDLKYIIKRVIVGVLISLSIMFLNSNVFAYTIFENSNVNFDEVYIYNTFKSINADFDLNNYPYIKCETSQNSIQDITCTAFNQSYYDSLYLYKNDSQYLRFKNNNVSNVYMISFRYTVSSNSITVLYDYKDKSLSASTSSNYAFNINNNVRSSYTYTNFKPSELANLSSWAGDSNCEKLDFSAYTKKPYMRLDLLDSSYNQLSSVDCKDKENTYCTINSADDSKYLQVSYYLKSLNGSNIDILQGSYIQFNSKILNTLNTNVSVQSVRLNYYFEGSTENVSNKLYFVNKNGTYNNNNYSFVFSIKERDIYSSIYLYEYNIIYDLNDYINTSYSIPYQLNINSITDGGSSGSSSNDQQQQEIDNSQTIINQNDQMIDNQNTTNNKLDDINNTLNDDHIDDGKVNNSLNNISIPQSSLGPFAAFLTIPLQWVQSLLSSNQSCQILHLPLPFLNTYLDLPCMSDFWASTGLLGTLIQACWICVVAVRIFNGLFLLTVDVLNPNPESASQLTKIKTWEL